jgi:oligoribonuclease (3'-5' exoribonuclease)
LDPKQHGILELAFVLTEFRFPYLTLNRGHYLVNGPARLELIEGRSDDFIRSMHEASGLTLDLSFVENTTTLPTIEQDLLQLSERWPLEDKNARVVIAGSSVGFDLGFLRQHMPAFAKRLSYRVFDVSVMKMVCRSMGMPYEDEKTEPSHRAPEDIEYSIQRMKDCVDWLEARNSLRAP